MNRHFLMALGLAALVACVGCDSIKDEVGLNRDRFVCDADKRYTSAFQFDITLFGLSRKFLPVVCFVIAVHFGIGRLVSQDGTRPLGLEALIIPIFARFPGVIDKKDCRVFEDLFIESIEG